MVSTFCEQSYLSSYIYNLLSVCLFTYPSFSFSFSHIVMLTIALLAFLFALPRRKLAFFFLQIVPMEFEFLYAISHFLDCNWQFLFFFPVQIISMADTHLYVYFIGLIRDPFQIPCTFPVCLIQWLLGLLVVLLCRL